MNKQELAKYLSKYVSFTINKNAYLPAPKVEGKDMRDMGNYYEGILRNNNGILSHFALDSYDEHTKQWKDIAIRDSTVPYIENFKIKEKLN